MTFFEKVGRESEPMENRFFTRILSPTVFLLLLAIVVRASHLRGEGEKGETHHRRSVGAME
jgi:hypothetical protein